MSVVRTLRVRVDWVQFPAARPRYMENEIVINNLLVRYSRFGQMKSVAGEKCLLFLHGWRSNKEVWGGVVEKLLVINKELSVFCLDLPGFGKSPAPKKPFSVGDYAETVAEFIKKENLSNIILVGHSFGGRVGIKLASQFPNLVSKLVLVNSAGFVSKARHKNLITLIAKLTKPFFVPNFMQGLRKSIYRALGLEDYLATPMLQETFKKVIAEDLTADMQRITIPTLIIWGENDKETPVEFGERMKTLIPNSVLKILPNAGHFSFLDQPENFTKILNEFI